MVLGVLVVVSQRCGSLEPGNWQLGGPGGFGEGGMGVRWTGIPGEAAQNAIIPTGKG